MSFLKCVYLVAALIGMFCVKGYSTIFFLDNPFLGESYLPYSGGPYYPTEQQLQASRQVVQNNAVWGHEVVMTSQGPQQVQVFGVAPPGTGYPQQSTYYSSQGQYYHPSQGGYYQGY